MMENLVIRLSDSITVKRIKNMSGRLVNDFPLLTCCSPTKVFSGENDFPTLFQPKIGFLKFFCRVESARSCYQSNIKLVERISFRFSIWRVFSLIRLCHWNMCCDLFWLESIEKPKHLRGKICVKTKFNQNWQLRLSDANKLCKPLSLELLKEKSTQSL